MGIESILQEHLAVHGTWRESPAYETLGAAVGRTLAYYLQYVMESEKKYDDAKAVDMVPVNMIGYPTEREQALEQAHNAARVIGSVLYQCPEKALSVDKLKLMVNGSSLPVRAEIHIATANSPVLEQIAYIKPFDRARIVGIELYTLMGCINEDYTYFCNNGVIVENSLRGFHEFERPEIAKAIKGLPAYWNSRTKCDVISFVLGIDDIAKQDNYMITEQGDIKFIDFDVMGRCYSPADRCAIRERTRKELGISEEQYDHVFAREESFLRDRIQRYEREIFILLEALIQSDDEQEKNIGLYIKGEVQRVLTEK